MMRSLTKMYRITKSNGEFVGFINGDGIYDIDPEIYDIKIFT